jgi:hypothetical protein
MKTKDIPFFYINLFISIPNLCPLWLVGVGDPRVWGARKFLLIN